MLGADTLSAVEGQTKNIAFAILFNLGAERSRAFVFIHRRTFDLILLEQNESRRDHLIDRA